MKKASGTAVVDIHVKTAHAQRVQTFFWVNPIDSCKCGKKKSGNKRGGAHYSHNLDRNCLACQLDGNLNTEIRAKSTAYTVHTLTLGSFATHFYRFQK